MKRIFGSVVALVTLAVLVPACSDGGGLTLSGAWARSPAEDVGAVYFIVANLDEADALVGVSADVEGRVEIHETVMLNGEAEMQPVDSVQIPGDSEVPFEPGGYHVMLFDLAEPLEIGDTIGLTLTFENAGDVAVDAEVREFVGIESGMGGEEDEGM